MELRLPIWSIVAESPRSFDNKLGFRNFATPFYILYSIFPSVLIIAHDLVELKTDTTLYHLRKLQETVIAPTTNS
jgi:hypothetical protein